MSRGRPSENVVKLTKWELETNESVWKYDTNKFPNGPYSVEQKFQAGNKPEKFKVDQKPYGKLPVVMVFKTSNRSNAKTKITGYRIKKGQKADIFHQKTYKNHDGLSKTKTNIKRNVSGCNG